MKSLSPSTCFLPISTLMVLDEEFITSRTAPENEG